MRFFRRRPAAGPLRLRLLSRPGCHLCEQLQAAAAPAIGAAGGTLTIVDIDSDPALAARWGDEIPVILDEAGRTFARALDSEAKIRQRLGL